MIARVAALALALALAGSACQGGEADPADAAAHTQWPDAEPPWPGITLDLRPDVEHGELAVAVRVSGEHAASITELSVARTWADTHGAEAITDVRVRYGDDDIPLMPRPDDGGPDRVVGLARAPRGGELLVR